MKGLWRFLAICVLVLGFGILVSYILKTDRIYTHFFYIPIAIAASQHPKLTVPLGVFFALAHLIVEYSLRGQFDTIALFRASILVVVAVSLSSIWGKEQRYQRTIQNLDFQRYHDGLTGLYNRRYFEDLSSQMLEYPLAFIVCDVDRLKAVNDEYGHLVGDNYITATATILHSCLREKDKLIRMGGDEFLLIAEKCDQTRAKQINERILLALNQFNDQNIKNLPLKLSFSLGSAICLQHQQYQACIEQADFDMYAIKDAKRQAHAINL